MARKIISISTKTGDSGETGLIDGRRISKSSQVFEVIGSLDELNSWIGLVAAKLGEQFHEQRSFLFVIQDTLFILGAQIAGSKKVELKLSKLRELEKMSEALQHAMSDNWHSKFILPGGTELGGYLDIARTVCRRVERENVRLQQDQKVPSLILQYLNRLSDYLYLLRCFINHAVEYQEQQFNTWTYELIPLLCLEYGHLWRR